MKREAARGSREKGSPEGSVSSHRSQHARAGRRGPAELTVSGDSSEPAAKWPALDLGSVPPPARSSRATSEQAAISGRQLVSPEGGATYAADAAAAVAATNAAPQHPSGPLMPTAKGSDPSEPAVSHETADRRMSFDISGPLSGILLAQLVKPKWPPAASPQRSALTNPHCYFRGQRHQGLLGVAAGILPQQPDGPAECQESSGGSGNTRRL
jgi:hypothetical protein